MITFKVEDMTCGHCTATITQAIQDYDPGLRVMCDLSNHTVQIVAELALCKPLEAVIRTAGYTPVAV